MDQFPVVVYLLVILFFWAPPLALLGWWLGGLVSRGADDEARSRARRRGRRLGCALAFLASLVFVLQNQP